MRARSGCVFVFACVIIHQQQQSLSLSYHSKRYSKSSRSPSKTATGYYTDVKPRTSIISKNGSPPPTSPSRPAPGFQTPFTLADRMRGRAARHRPQQQRQVYKRPTAQKVDRGRGKKHHRAPAEGCKLVIIYTYILCYTNLQQVYNRVKNAARSIYTGMGNPDDVGEKSRG